MSVSHACASEAEAIGVSSNEAKIAAGGEPRSASIVFAISLKDETGQRDFTQRRAIVTCLFGLSYGMYGRMQPSL